MTNKEAIKIIKNYNVNGCGYCHQGGDEVEEAFQMAIQALEQQPCDDSISREAVIKIFGEVHPMDYNTQAYITNIQNLPSITPQQTDKIEESNYSKEQYEADLQGAYDCGYSCGYVDAMIDIAESEKV